MSAGVASRCAAAQPRTARIGVLPDLGLGRIAADRLRNLASKNQGRSCKSGLLAPRPDGRVCCDSICANTAAFPIKRACSLSLIVLSWMACIFANSPSESPTPPPPPARSLLLGGLLLRRAKARRDALKVAVEVVGERVHPR